MGIYTKTQPYYWLNLTSQKETWRSGLKRVTVHSFPLASQSVMAVPHLQPSLVHLSPCCDSEADLSFSLPVSVISSSSFTYSVLLLINSLFIPSLCSCCRMPRHLRARWWFWSAGSVEALLCRSDGTARERRSWTLLIFVFSRKVRHSS